MQAGLAAAHLFAGRFDAASSWAEKAFRELPSFLMVVSVIAASHALAGRPNEAQRAMKHLRELIRRCASPSRGSAPDPPARGPRDLRGRVAEGGVARVRRSALRPIM